MQAGARVSGGALYLLIALSGCGDSGGAADGGGASAGSGGRDSASGGSGTGGAQPVASCDGVTCSGRGACEMVDGAATCVCDDGYHAVGVLCITNDSTDLCDGLITDTEDHPMVELAKPALGEAYTDPSFGTTIRRITDVGGTGVIKPVYSPTQAWNADETYLVLYEVGARHRLYDGHTYEFVRTLDISPPDLEQIYWSTSDPDIMFWIEGNELMRYRASTDSSEPIHTIDCDGSVQSESHGWISWDSNVLGLFCPSSDTAFIYELDSGTILGRAEGSSAPIIAPTGTLAYWRGDIVDQSMNVVRTLDLGNVAEHSSLGMLGNGHDTYNLVQFDRGPDGSEVGSLVVFDMTDGSYRVIIGPSTGYQYPPSGTHLSAPVYKRPGWVFLSIIGEHDGQEALDQELVLANTNEDSTVVCRIGHHRSQEAQDYWGEPHVSGSPSGTRALFASDWNGGDSVDTYVVELPSYQ